MSLRHAAPKGGMPEFSDLILACRHHLVATCVIGLIVSLGLAIGAWHLIPPQYRAKGLLRVREQRNVVFAAQTTRADDLAFFRSQAKLVASPQVLAVAMNDQGLKPFTSELPETERIEWLAKCLDVETEAGSEVMSIVASHRSPRLAHALSCAVTQAYLAEITNRLAYDYQQRERELERAARAADVELDKLWDKLNSVAESVGTDRSESMTLRDEMQFQAYRDYARQLQAAQLRGNQLQSKLAEEEQEWAEQVASRPDVADAALHQHPEIIQAKNALARLSQKINQLRDIAVDPNSPQIVTLMEQQRLILDDIAQNESLIRSEIAEQSRSQTMIERQATLTDLKQQIQLNRSEKDFLRERLSEMDSVVSASVETTAIPLDMSRHAVERQSRLADSLWQSLQELKIEGQSQPRVTLIELAKLPEHATHSKQLKAAAGSALCGWILVVFAIGYREWRACRVRFADDVVSHSRFPVFGTSAFAKSQSNTLSWAKHIPQENGVNEAAVNVFLKRNPSTLAPTVMVTSCTPKELRHRVAQELATVLGGYRRRVLVIDCDTGPTRLSDMLGVADAEGMVQLSIEQAISDLEGDSGEEAFDAVAKRIISTDHPQIHLLPVGFFEQQQTWIDPRTLRRVLNMMQSRYDAIIVNGPSILGSPQGHLLGAEVDTNLLAVQVNKTRWSQIVLCEQAAYQAELSMGGAVLFDTQNPIQGQLRSVRQTLPKIPPKKLPSPKSATARKNSDEDLLCVEIEELRSELRKLQPTSISSPSHTNSQSTHDSRSLDTH
ncbi:Tyrosine-protein kinase ptk [Planctomycetes bacterium CA13]|uniref:Tyrosine-protein kinase ptk n=2 Tax=Novipirellula herctigrandis TaxID=2527986 RepID=A0A5C5Z5Y4_9BACT|nr:Tyrosine-protein kinase ptk [Planctomycetes bacterium CA13]